MDDHREKEADKSRESSEQQQPRKEEVEEDDDTEESMNQHQEGYKVARDAEEEPTVQLKEVESGSEEASSLFGIFAQHLLRACAGWCWGLHGAFDDDGPKPQQAAAAVALEAAAPANSTEQGDGGEKANNYFCMQELVTRVWAGRRGRPPSDPPGPPIGGRGENGGIHH